MKLRSFVLVPVAARQAACDLAASLGVSPSSDLRTLGIALVPIDGPDDAPATHYGGDGQLPDHIRLALRAASGQFVGNYWVQTCDEGSRIGECLESSDGELVGQVVTWDVIAESRGLKRRVISQPEI